MDLAAFRRENGGVVLRAFFDAHVHLGFSDPVAVARGGVAAVLDLGGPLPPVQGDGPLRVARSGQILTAPGGYPLESWGADGYGRAVDGPDEARRAVAELVAAGAAVVKVAIAPERGQILGRLTLAAIVDEAHRRGRRVAAHTLSAHAVRIALHAEVDILAHTPTERLPDHLVAELGRRRTTVISTVCATGDGPDRRRNLAALAVVGCPIAYGTDLGDEGVEPGISVGEVAALAEALGSLEAAVHAATVTSVEVVGLPLRDDLLWLPRLERPEDLTSPDRQVLIGGRMVT